MTPSQYRELTSQPESHIGEERSGSGTFGDAARTYLGWCDSVFLAVPELMSSTPGVLGRRSIRPHCPGRPNPLLALRGTARGCYVPPSSPANQKKEPRWLRKIPTLRRCSATTTKPSFSGGMRRLLLQVGWRDADAEPLAASSLRSRDSKPSRLSSSLSHMSSVVRVMAPAQRHAPSGKRPRVPACPPQLR